MKTKIQYAVVLYLISLLNSCSPSINILIDKDETTDFNKYNTFAWLPDKIDTTNVPYNNEIIRNNIRNYFGHHFSERGYKVNLENPDLLLSLTISAKKKEKTEYTAYPSPYYYNRYYYGSIYYIPYAFDYYYRYYPSFRYPADYLKQTVEYIEGAITLNVFDRATNKLIWSGTAKKDIYDPAYVKKDIHPAVDKIMKEYPVRPLNERLNSNAGI
jgi:hypothetical protein